MCSEKRAARVLKSRNSVRNGGTSRNLSRIKLLFQCVNLCVSVLFIIVKPLFHFRRLNISAAVASLDTLTASKL